MFLFGITAIVLVSCKKEGPGGKNTIVAFPKHHSSPIPGTKVYIKYGTKNFPGEDVSKYDAFKIAEKEGNSPDVHVHFEDLQKGDYYLYGVGYDSAISQIVKGGIPVSINTKSGETTVTLPITED